MADAPVTFYEQELERMAATVLLPEYQYVQVRQSRAFMEKYLSESIDLEQMAGAAFMSRFHFIRIFQQVYGVTPRHCLRDLRISRAKELLRAGFSVTRVCLDVGYESLPTFSAVFKRATGYSPRDYQKSNNRNLE